MPLELGLPPAQRQRREEPLGQALKEANKDNLKAIKEMMVLIAKLGLAAEYQARVARAVSDLEVCVCPTAGDMVQAGLEAGRGYAQQAAGVAKEDREQQLGLPHTSIFLAIMNKAEAQAATISGQAKADFERYAAHYTQIKDSKNMQAMHQALQKDIPYCRVKKTYARDYAKIEIKVSRQSAAWTAWEHARTILCNQGGVMKYGMAPSSDIARRVQQVLEELGESRSHEERHR